MKYDIYHIIHHIGICYGIYHAISHRMFIHHLHSPPSQQACHVPPVAFSTSQLLADAVQSIAPYASAQLQRQWPCVADPCHTSTSRRWAHTTYFRCLSLCWNPPQLLGDSRTYEAGWVLCCHLHSTASAVHAPERSQPCTDTDWAGWSCWPCQRTLALRSAAWLNWESSW